MYEALLQSADRPFRATPDTKFYYPSDSIEQARQTVVRAVLRAEGPCLVLGGAGLGKTMLGQMIADDVYGRFDIVRLHASGLCSRRALLQSILFELQMPYRGLSEGELRMSIMDRLSPSPETAPSGILLLIDEAHTLSPKLLEELRLITNFARNGQPRARLVLFGNMRLEDTFAHPQLDSFNQRLAARCYLQPMTRDQTMEFVRHQLRCLQIEPPTLITNDALRTLYSASEGVPRLVNQVMDHALVLGITTGQCPISAALVEEAWSDLQQLPAPWHASNAPEKPAAAAKNSIEFGELSDDDEESFTESTHPESMSARSPKATVVPTAVDSPRLSLGTTNEDASQQSDNFAADAFAAQAEDTYELAPEDEPLDVISKAPKQNFFAAFAPVGSMDSNVEEEAAEQDESTASPADTLQSKITVAIATPQPALAATARVVLDASQAFGFHRPQATLSRGTETVAQAIAEQVVAPAVEPLAFATPSIADLSAASFFGSHPSDVDILDIEDAYDEILTAVPDTQSIWENDPPLHETPPHPSHAPAPMASINQNDLFGEDFEEEIAIANKGGLSRERRLFAPKAVEAASAMPLTARQAAAEEQLAAMESQRLELEDTRPYEDAEQARKYAAASLANDTERLVASWTVDVAASESDREIALHMEIEDLVSQLNFSAFAVEPFSVEQIAIDYARTAKPAKSSHDLHDINEDRETIYTLHTPESTEMDDDIHSNLTLDDDRDLLIIEEELPVSNRMTAEQLDAPVVKAATYSQLFAKLRH